MVAEAFPLAEMNALELSPDMIKIAREVVNRSQHTSRVRFVHGSVDDAALMGRLGKFDLVYSTFSLHHWEHPVRAICAMYKALGKGGLMLLHDFKRVPWLYLLPGHGGFIGSIRASYRPREIQGMMQQAHIDRYEMKTPFPYFWHTVSATA
jgi:ubiquinone/menaquinone biosynthesis C-methylase UbiE